MGSRLPRRQLICAMVPIMAAVVAGSLAAQPDSAALTVPAPGRGSGFVHRVVDSAATWTMLHLDYREAAAGDGDWKLPGLRGVDGVRLFVRDLDEGGRRSLEMGASRRPAGGFELHVYGLERRAGTQAEPNPDLAAVESQLRQLLEGDAALITKRTLPADADAESFELDLDRVAFEIVHLSYAQSDRVLGLLKALGYSTVEFVAQVGDTPFEAIYEPLFQGEARLPVIVKIIEPTKTSILDPVPPPPGPPSQVRPGSREEPAVPDIGGQLLHQATSGEALQRLLVVHDPERPEALAKLRRLLREQIDVASRQIVLEALVIEIDTDRLRDLGVTFNWQSGKSSASFEADAGGNQLPFTYVFDKSADFISQFRASLHALVVSGHAEILTNPSVLVLDGRQARIQIGQQIPVVSSTATTTAVSQRVEYFPVGIVLNIRPRLDEDAREVTMQVETIVSSVSSTGGTVTSVGDDVFFAPAIDNRQVQTFVRIADNTPFIIGGLIATEESESVKGVPGLSKIPGLGALFRRKSKSRVKQEVIIVLTPHVVPLDEKSFGWAVPKEASVFDSYGHELFRNAYRLRSQDIFDLAYLRRSPDLLSLRAAIGERVRLEGELAAREPFAGLLAGRIPGEEILVRRMLWEVIGELGADRLVKPDHIIFFQPRSAGGFEVAYLRDQLAGRETRPGEVLELSFALRSDGSAYAEPSWRPLPPEGYSELLRRGNPVPAPPSRPELATLVLGERPGSTPTLDVLRRVLVLERVLELNSSLPMELDALHAGLQIVFPSEENLTRALHLVDARTARLFYEVEEYYSAFERRFNAGIAEAFELLEGE